MQTKQEQAFELLKKLSRREILEITVGQASTSNLMDDLIEIYSDSEESIDELISECECRLTKE